MEGNGTMDRLEGPSNFILVPAVIAILCGTIADILIIVATIRTRKWYSTFNLYVMNWCLCDALLMVLQPTTYIVIFSVDFVERNFFCIWMGEIVVVTIGNFIFVAALTLDWFFAQYFANVSTKIRRFSKIQIGAIWVAIVVLTIYICCKCIMNQAHVWIFSVTTVSLVMYFIIQILWFIKRKTGTGNEKSNLAMALISCYFLCWFPNYLIQAIRTFEGSSGGGSVESNVVTSLIGYMNSVIMLLLLYYGDEELKNGFNTLCSRQVEEPETLEAK
ncbi:neuromedin-B receptor-like [Tribolium madens]|uniref:neuromedin-B receptor-like n=1 Tax=Tribolium madens TaxID=41895 RepID=UPI001CF75231|nr:neuromedin-B receptor-like [Tribolium madens]